MEFDVFSYVWLPLMIFFARICDVTIGTMRIILVARGNKVIAPLLGFVEVFIWIIAIGQIMDNANNIICYLFYAGGFATGNYIGMLIEEKIALGIVGLRLIIPKQDTNLINDLKANGYGYTLMEAQGAKGNVQVILITVNRKGLNNLISLINTYNPDAFYTIEDVRNVNRGIFKSNSTNKSGSSWRKGK